MISLQNKINNPPLNFEKIIICYKKKVKIKFFFREYILQYVPTLDFVFLYYFLTK